MFPSVAHRTQIKPNLSTVISWYPPEYPKSLGDDHHQALAGGICSHRKTYKITQGKGCFRQGL